MGTTKTEKLVTKIAHWMSFGCFIHCILTPVLILALPVASRGLHNHSLEAGLFIVSIASGIWVIYSGYCQHKKQHSVFIFFLGAVAWVLHLLSGHSHAEDYANLLLIIGAVFVVSSYITNHYFLRCCQDADCCDH